MKRVLSSILLAAWVLFGGAAAGAGDKDLSIRFMIDGSGAMKSQGIATTTASCLVAEIIEFINTAQPNQKGTRILADLFWQKGTTLNTKGIFDYRLGQFDKPDYDGLGKNFKTEGWFVDNETSLNKLVNRNWPTENRNTVLVVLTNSQKSLDTEEIEVINKEAQALRSQLFIVTLPRPNEYKDDALPREIGKRTHAAMEKVKAFIRGLQPKARITCKINGQEKKVTDTISCVAPAEIALTADDIGDSKFFWRYNGREIASAKLEFSAKTAAKIKVEAVTAGPVGGNTVRTILFDVLPSPKATADFSVFPTSGPAPLEVTITNNSINGKKYQWDFGDGATSAENAPTHTYRTPGKYAIVLNVLSADGTPVTFRKEIQVTYAAPVADFSWDEKAKFAPAEVAFRNTSRNTVRYEWNFGDGSAVSGEKNPKHSFDKAGKYTVTLKAFNGDGKSAVQTRTLDLQPGITAAFDFEFSSSNPKQAAFRNQSSGATSYRWDFGDGTTSEDAEPTHIYDTAETRTYTVTLTAQTEDGRQNVQSREITIRVAAAPPTASFTAEATPAGSSTFKFTNKSRGAARYNWDFGDGNTSTEASPTHQYHLAEDRTVTVVLRVTADDGQTAAKSEQIKVPAEGDSSWLIIVVIVLVLGIGGAAVWLLVLRKKHEFTVVLRRGREESGRKIVKLKDQIVLSDLGGPEIFLQIVKAEEDDDSGEEFKVRFRKLAGDAEVKQKMTKITLEEQWSEPVSLSNLTVDGARLEIMEGKEEGGEN